MESSQEGGGISLSNEIAALSPPLRRGAGGFSNFDQTLQHYFVSQAFQPDANELDALPAAQTRQAGRPDLQYIKASRWVQIDFVPRRFEFVRFDGFVVRLALFAAQGRAVTSDCGNS